MGVGLVILRLRRVQLWFRNYSAHTSALTEPLSYRTSVRRTGTFERRDVTATRSRSVLNFCHAITDVRRQTAREAAAQETGRIMGKIKPGKRADVRAPSERRQVRSSAKQNKEERYAWPAFCLGGATHRLNLGDPIPVHTATRCSRSIRATTYRQFSYCTIRDTPIEKSGPSQMLF
jgi:hypothetical protein